jgi:hypothetical protein
MPDEEAGQEERIPLSDALPGFGIHPLEVEWTPLEAFVLVKCLDENGQSTWGYRTTHRPNREELLGALIVQVDLLRRELAAQWEEEED